MDVLAVDIEDIEGNIAQWIIIRNSSEKADRYWNERYEEAIIENEAVIAEAA